jgi:hypothetical protein
MIEEGKSVIATIEIDIDEEGTIVGAREGNKDLEYGEDEIKANKRMDNSNTGLISNPCRWRKIGGRWRCV